MVQPGLPFALMMLFHFGCKCDSNLKKNCHHYWFDDKASLDKIEKNECHFLF